MATFLDPRSKATKLTPDELEEVSNRAAAEGGKKSSNFLSEGSNAPPKQQGINVELLDWWSLHCSHFPLLSRLAQWGDSTEARK